MTATRGATRRLTRSAASSTPASLASTVTTIASTVSNGSSNTRDRPATRSMRVRDDGISAAATTVVNTSATMYREARRARGITTSPRTSTRAFAGDDRTRRGEEDAQVGPQRPGSDVAEIQADHFVEGRAASAL